LGRSIRNEGEMVMTYTIPEQLTVIYYTSNWMDDKNPFFIENVRKQLLVATTNHNTGAKLPIVIVSQKPTMFGDNSTNVCVGDIGRSHLNIYKQILAGAKEAKTPFIAMAEDDILYTFAHFHNYLPTKRRLAFDMSRWSVFTWSRPPMYSYRKNRKVIHEMIAPRDLVIEALEERFAKVEQLLKDKELTIEQIESRWGDLGRYEDKLGVKILDSEEFWTASPNVVFSHEMAYGFLNHNVKKLLGEIRAFDIPEFGHIDKTMNLFYKDGWQNHKEEEYARQ
jgi:hypothetical protein